MVGLIAYLAIFLSVFYYGLGWIGLIPSRRHFYTFAGLCLVGGILGAALLGIWRGVEYVGLGLPLGITFGLLLYLAYSTLTTRSGEERSTGYNRVFTLIILLTAIIAHFVEINFGIAIGVTRTYFWVFSGLLVLVGFLMPQNGEYGDSSTQEVDPRDEVARTREQKKETRISRTKRQRKPEKRFLPAGQLVPDWLKESLVAAGIVTLILVTLGFDYITNSGRITSAIVIIFNSLSRLPTHENALSFGVLMLVLTTWVVSAVILIMENSLISANRKWLVTFLVTLGVSGLFTGIFWFRHALGLAVLASHIPSTINEVVEQVSNINYFLTHYYIYILVILLCMGMVLPEFTELRKSENTLVSVLVSLVVIVGVTVMVYLTNLRVIHADITFKMGEPFNRPGQWEVATHLYQRANRLVPDQDHYYLFLGRSYLERAKEEDDPKQQEMKVREAEQDLKLAQSINPLNTDHSVNLARLYSWWATQASDVETQRERGETAARYYDTALMLSPNNSTLLGESALLYLDVLGQPKEAYARLQRALDLDPKYNWTQGLMGDFYLRVGKVMTDTKVRQDAFAKAIDHYTSAVELSKSSDVQLKIGFLAALADAYIGSGNLEEAIQAYQEALSLQPRESDLWRIEQSIASLYIRKGDRENALNHALQALSDAPDDQKPAIQSLIDEINQSP